jgi:hypothetical protein
MMTITTTAITIQIHGCTTPPPPPVIVPFGNDSSDAQRNFSGSTARDQVLSVLRVAIPAASRERKRLGS